MEELLDAGHDCLPLVTMRFVFLALSMPSLACPTYYSLFVASATPNERKLGSNSGVHSYVFEVDHPIILGMSAAEIYLVRKYF